MSSNIFILRHPVRQSRSRAPGKRARGCLFTHGRRIEGRIQVQGPASRLMGIYNRLMGICSRLFDRDIRLIGSAYNSRPSNTVIMISDVWWA